LFDHHLAYHSNAKRYAMKYGAADSQVTVMHNTINEQRIKRVAKHVARRQMDARFPSLKGRIIVLFVGAVLSEKRLDCVIDAFDRMKDVRFAFLVIGDGPYLSRLQARCAGRTDVVFAGRIVEDVGPFFDGADVFLLPGTGGLALNEAMIHGLPVVSGYADGSADDLIQDGVNGFRLRSGGAAELAERLRELATDGALRASMGLASRELMTTRFSFQSFVQCVTAVLDTV
jgi:glycosyltransferase involved in cell wall biosynthesis